MSLSLDDSQRRMIPRWRDSSTTVTTGEFVPLYVESDVAKHNQSDEEFLEAKIRDWQENKSCVFASDLVGAALVLGRHEVARDAANFLLANSNESSQPAVELARAVLGMPRLSESATSTVQGPRPEWLAIHNLRRRLQDDARNSLGWADLSRLYTTIGLTVRALESMQLAIYLAPSDRFVLRSAARLFVHLDDAERAHDLLRRNRRATEDPWIAAAEIAIAPIVGRTSKLFKPARLMLSKFEPFQVTELASAIGTLESVHGNRREAKRLFELALKEPNENTVAQAGWIARQSKAIVFDPEYLKVPRSYEARAWQHYSAHRWHDALSECHRWLEDEPFSSRPAVLGSFITATELDDFQESERLARLGLSANPEDITLLNNLVYALASGGELAEALKTFLKIDQNSLDQNERAVLYATEGVLRFRNGDVLGGRQLYSRAIEFAEHSGDKLRAALVAAFWAKEELRLRTPESEQLLRQAIDRARGHEDAGLRGLLKKMSSQEPNEKPKDLTK
jgi:tetratricopeptide (TPR) repeat protein